MRIGGLRVLKYLKYYIPAITGILGILFFSMGQNYPTFFFISWSIFMIIGDYVLPRDKEIQQFSHPSILNFSIYINLPILFCLIFLVISIFSSNPPSWYVDGLNSQFNIDFIQIKESFTIIDKIALISQTALFVGILGTVPGHELVHRKKNKFDMFIGNWLLAFSWDCTFAIEHVHGHHKDVCLDEDPASAKRGENIYLFILRATLQEQISGWKIETERLKRRKLNVFSIQNRMIIGYFRSLSITIAAFIFCGLAGMLIFLLCAFLAKLLLEAINYIEHYGLVRERGKQVNMRHSWNSNHLLSSIYLCNVTRHSDHHRAANLKFWELNPCPEDAPLLPYGYLSMLYLVLFTPFLYTKLMAKELIDWDQNYATEYERNYNM
ncbi:MAG: alkane 1-monooxygenase [Candidatus Thalassarchaeaceae archaeon]|jgi:alkane 1-monooxygenase|nr:alkane 1-monooxygenase [Candidatus Thalassarchaeaceae archaeon]